MRRWGASAASAIVMDPYTGSVLAMAVAPRFNANRFPTTRADRRRNRAVTDTYEPGSTFKLVAIAAALEEGVVSPTTAFRLPPSLKVADRVIHESHVRGTQRMTVKQIVEYSSNIGTITIAQRLGEGRMASWIDRFGFGRETGIDFPGESPGFALPLENGRGRRSERSRSGTDRGHAHSDGACLRRDRERGVLVRPRLIDRIDGRPVAGSLRRRIVSRTVSERMLGMLKGVVVEGTGREAAIPGYTVAGKTGTAAKIDPDGRHSSRYVASFIGLVPATKPRLVIMVMVDEPRGNFYGGVVAAPAFRKSPASTSSTSRFRRTRRSRRRPTAHAASSLISRWSSTP